MNLSKPLLYLLCLFFIIATSCKKDEATKLPGTISVVFNSQVGDNNLNLRAAGNQAYDFMDTNGQHHNISKFGYYISGIKFSGPEGLGYNDPNKITADASKITGFYHILESDPASQVINIDNVTARTYDKIEFIIGVKSYTVITGPPGGILDPANGAWFLNMDAGYVNLAIEGNASNSGQKYVSMGNEPDILEGTFSIHTSGWRDIAPELGQEPVFVDNTKTIKLDFDEILSVEDGLNPEIHINVDLAKILEGIDFSETFDIKTPYEGRSFSSKFTEAFTLGFVMQ